MNASAKYQRPPWIVVFPVPTTLPVRPRPASSFPLVFTRSDICVAEPPVSNSEKMVNGFVVGTDGILKRTPTNIALAVPVNAVSPSAHTPVPKSPHGRPPTPPDVLTPNDVASETSA